jgi:SAM-dependent methyltransferase
MTGLPWDASYHHGPAPWDIGQPQPAVVRLASKGGFAGAVLDAGCGTRENTLLVASLGLSVLGVDVAETALAIAREKANDRGIEVEFAAADAFQLERLGRMFLTVLDCGLFHTFDGDERPGYVASLASVTEHDGTLYVLCFSDAGPDTGPHLVSEDELRAAFGPNSGWKIVSIEPDAPAAKAGLLLGDIVVAIDGENIESFEQLLDVLSGEAVGKTLHLDVVRAGEQRPIDLVIGERPRRRGRR